MAMAPHTKSVLQLVLAWFAAEDEGGDPRPTQSLLEDVRCFVESWAHPRQYLQRAWGVLGRHVTCNSFAMEALKVWCSLRVATPDTHYLPPWVREQHPFVSEEHSPWTFVACVERIRSHGVSKDPQHDPFTAALVSFKNRFSIHSAHQLRALVVLLFMVCSVRSEFLLDLFARLATDCSNKLCFVDATLPGVLIEKMVQRGRAYNSVQMGLMPGMRPAVPPAAHTTEQRTRSIYDLLRLFLHPYLHDEKTFDYCMDLSQLRLIDLGGVPLIKGRLVRPHTEKYLQHMGLMVLEEFLPEEHATNSEMFLEMVRNAGFNDYEAVAVHLNVSLALTPPVDAREASAAACMTVRAMECYLGGSSRGKHYGTPFKFDPSPMFKRLQKFLNSHDAPKRKVRKTAAK